MRWHKANRNKRRAHVREMKIQIDRRYFARTFDARWEEWLKKLLPTMLNEHSVMARILMRKPEPTPTWRTQVPRLPPFRGTKTNLEILRRQVQNPILVFDDIDDLPD